MKTLKIILILLGFVCLLAFAAGTYVKVALPNVGPAPDLKIVSKPSRLENGKYLANHVSVCMDCHSSRDWTKFAGPMQDKGFGAGGEVFNQKMGFPGNYIAPNLTPYSLRNWTDGEIFRAITTGVNKDGKALFPVMAAHRFGTMDKQDIYDIIVYLRTLKAVKHDVAKSESDFPVNFLINTMPKKANFQQKPNPADSIKYGAYLVNAAGCVDCHSKTDKGAIIKGTEFGGGMEFGLPTGIVRSSNITPDESTGIGQWNKIAFIARFKNFEAGKHTPVVVKEGMNTPMPWTMYAGMNEKDLGAIYTYLQSLKPIKNQVERFTLSSPKQDK
ncbi:c-type cytochrome [Pedobacter jamesrossensis]|uniref:C-type cytochrome n=1 Tax=Pedobacter jamesrossensis TaxID=1908238 RepID=A0ABV8NRJ2_9SPHI